ncbi:TPA: hypothetical protein QDB01_000387 [Burkholderia vietnamiensis]|nr:hypothetical protein [Burkholderia vietnamiensis]
MNNDTQSLDPAMAAPLDSLDDDAVGASAQPEDAVLHAEPTEPTVPQPVQAVPSVAELPVVAPAGQPAAPAPSGMTPAIEEANRKRAALIEAAQAVLIMINGPDGQSGIAKLVRNMNVGLDGARLVLGSSFGAPKETLERLMEGHVIETITPEMFRDLRSGKAFQFPVLKELESKVATMSATHEAWTAAMQVAASDVQAYRAATRGRVIEPVITRCVERPHQFRDAHLGNLALAHDLKVLQAEVNALGAFAEAYEKALDGDWSAVDSWIRDNKDAFAKAIAQADAAMASAVLPEDAPAAVEPDPQPNPAAARNDEHAEAEPEVPLSDDDVILEPIEFEEPVQRREFIITAPKDFDLDEDAVFVDAATGEVVRPTLAEVQAVVKDAENLRWDDPANADTLLGAGLMCLFAARHLLDHDAKAKFHFQKDGALLVKGYVRASRAGLEAEGDGSAASPDALPDRDPMDDGDAWKTPVTNASDAGAPRSDDEDESDGFDPIAFAKKNLYAIAGGIAVLVLGAGFLVGHSQRPAITPNARPVPGQLAVPAPATIPAPVPASVPAASVPVVNLGPIASAPVVTPPAVPSTPAVAAPAIVPASVPAPVQPPAPVTPVAPAAAPKPVVKPEVRKAPRPVVHEHVTTMRETNQALDQLRAKLGE